MKFHRSGMHKSADIRTWQFFWVGLGDVALSTIFCGLLVDCEKTKQKSMASSHKTGASLLRSSLGLLTGGGTHCDSVGGVHIACVGNVCDEVTTLSQRLEAATG